MDLDETDMASDEPLGPGGARRRLYRFANGFGATVTTSSGCDRLPRYELRIIAPNGASTHDSHERRDAEAVNELLAAAAALRFSTP